VRCFLRGVFIYFCSVLHLLSGVFWDFCLDSHSKPSWSPTDVRFGASYEGGAFPPWVASG
jgi:hypothetical protein